MNTNHIDGTVTWDVVETPLGPLTLEASRRGLRAVHFPGRGPARAEERRDPARLAGAAAQFEAYFAGERRILDLDLDLRCSVFDRAVWSRLLEIPYGDTISYSALARAVGRPDIVRGVAAAVGRNPLAIVVPCHRVIGADGALTGYRGGLQRKQALLDLEGRVAAGLDPQAAWAFRQLSML
jgi:methylated-DNA-[protein]-cysteine S-methyltransferase